MKETWSLDELYVDLESNEYINDKKLLNERIDELNDYMGQNLNVFDEKEVLLTYIERLEEIISLFKTSTYVHLYVTTHTNDEKYLKEQENLMKIKSKTALFHSLFTKYVSNITNLENLINSDNTLSEYKLFLTEIKDNSKFALSEKEEVLLSKLKETGSSAYTKLRDTYISSMLVEVNINGKIEKLPFPALRNLAFSNDEATRKEGYLKEIEALGKIEKTVAASLNGIKGEVLTECDLRGYDSPLQFTLNSQRMDEQTLSTMLKAMKEFLPEFERYFLKKAELLGHSNGLPFYDLFAPLGKSEMTFTYEEAADIIVKSFNEFSEELSQYADFAFKNQWIDAMPRENKREGAFCSNINTIGESRILSNFGGDYSGLTTLAHELGHGFHGHCLKSETLLNCNYPMPLAETASIFCETIIKNNALKTATKDEKLTILDNSLQDSSQVIVDILSRYTFEDNVFKNRVNGSLTPKELNNLMLEAQKYAYGKGLDEQYLHQYMWIVKGHYYSASRNYYNFPYAFGLLFATGLYAIYEKEPDTFIEKYKKLLRDTGKMTIYDVAKSVGIDLHDKEFYKNSLNVIKREIDEFCHL